MHYPSTIHTAATRFIVLLAGIILPFTIQSPAHADGARLADNNAWLEISAANFENNLAYLRDKVVAKNSKICAVMKADAYGHGIELLIPSAIKANVDAVCITHNSEAKIARDRGFTKRLIRIRIASIEEVEAALPYEVEEMGGTLAFMQAVSALGEKTGAAIKMHVNLNSAGMSRNGLDIDADLGQQEALAITKLPKLDIVGIMTHFPDEDAPAIKAGLDKFLAQANWVITQGKLDRAHITLHCANTAATVLVPESHLDMVRVGSLLYGQQPVGPPNLDIKPVMELKSKVASVHHFDKGDTVGYDRTFKLVRDSQLANIPIGYSDGYNRSFSNRMQVLIGGKRFPLVGKVTMNTIMVDVTGGGVKAGDEVVLLGKQGAEEIPMSELMAASYSFYGDFFVVVGNSNPKYLKNE